MTLVMFAWLVTQKYFREAQGSSLNIMKALETEQTALTEDNIVPFGVIDNGLEDPFEMSDGDVWFQTRGMCQEELQNAMKKYVERAHGL